MVFHVKFCVCMHFVVVGGVSRIFRSFTAANEELQLAAGKKDGAHIVYCKYKSYKRDKLKRPKQFQKSEKENESN